MDGRPCFVLLRYMDFCAVQGVYAMRLACRFIGIVLFGLGILRLGAEFANCVQRLTGRRYLVDATT